MRTSHLCVPVDQGERSDVAGSLTVQVAPYFDLNVPGRDGEARGTGPIKSGLYIFPRLTPQLPSSRQPAPQAAVETMVSPLPAPP